MSDITQKLGRIPSNKLKPATEKRRPASKSSGWKTSKIDYDIGIELSSNDTGDCFFNK